MAKNKIAYSTIIFTYISYTIMVCIGHIRDSFGKVFIPWEYQIFYESNGIPPLYTTFESFFIRRLYQRICDCWNRPITGLPDKNLKIIERISSDSNKTFKLTGNIIHSLNFGSYNYLGFANGPKEIKDEVLKIIDHHPINYAYPFGEIEQSEVTKTLEKEMAEFLYQEDCIVYSMGFGTNSWSISALMADSLIFSDELNHTSLISGMRLSSSKVVVFKHNNMRDLENKLRFWISQGQPETHRSWKKIFVIVEGIYSMEGTMVKLDELVDLKKKYKFYIFMDEAHSIGALGKHGRGICEVMNVDFKSVDIFMGTFSKSFGAAGGYVAANKGVIDYLRATSDGAQHAEQIAPVVAAQILHCLRAIVRDNSKIQQLLENTKYMRAGLKKLKFKILGHPISPVIPILIISPGKLGDFSRMCLSCGVAVVMVGYPACPVLESRVRICMSSAHTKEDIDYALSVINRIGTMMGIKG
ncbi:serine palmitoyltransferase [Enteropsectra breve]|nr:serine palmitoyltransferase [Enteropsectra breve]